MQRHLGREFFRFSVRIENVFGAGSAPSSEQPPGRELPIVGKDGERGLVAGEFPVPPQTQPPPVAAGSFRVRNQLVARDQEGQVVLGLLDGRVLRILDVGLDGVHSVLGRKASPAAGHGFDEGVVLSGSGIDSPAGHVAIDALGAGHDLVRHRVRKGPETQAAKAHDHFPAPDDTHWRNRVHDGSQRRLDVDEPVETLVGGDIGIDQALDQIGQRRIGLSQGGVHGGTPLRVGSGEVE